MALIANYTDLKAAVAEWLGKAGDATLVGRADEFISLFEDEFVEDPEMRLFEMEEVDTAPLSGTSITVPDGLIEMVRVQSVTGAGAPIQKFDYVTPDRAAVLDADTQTTSTCKNFTIIASQIVFAPQSRAPIGSIIELTYYSFTRLADALDGTNFLLSKYRNIYLYGSLMQAAAYIDDKDTVAMWAQALTRAMANLAKSDRKRKNTAGPISIRPSAGFIR